MSGVINVFAKNSFVHLPSTGPSVYRRAVSCSSLNYFSADEAKSPIYIMQDEFAGHDDSIMPRRWSIHSYVTGEQMSHERFSDSAKTTPAPSIADADDGCVGVPVGTATSVMIRNIPCRYTQVKLVDEIKSLALPFDFLYLPPAKHSRGNLGYGFINFETNEAATKFMEVFHGHKFKYQPNSQKRAEILYCALQGFEANYQFYGGYSRGRFRPYISAARLEEVKACRDNSCSRASGANSRGNSRSKSDI